MRRGRKTELVVKLTDQGLKPREIQAKTGIDSKLVRDIKSNHNMADSYKKREWAVYRGDDLVVMGNTQECLDELGISFNTFRWYTTPSGRRRSEESPTALAVVSLDK